MRVHTQRTCPNIGEVISSARVDHLIHTEAAPRAGSFVEGPACYTSRGSSKSRHNFDSERHGIFDIFCLVSLCHSVRSKESVFSVIIPLF